MMLSSAVDMHATRVWFDVLLTGVFLSDGILCNTHVAFLNPHTQHLPLSDCTLTHQKRLQKDTKADSSRLARSHTQTKLVSFPLVSSHAI